MMMMMTRSKNMHLALLKYKAVTRCGLYGGGGSGDDDDDHNDEGKKEESVLR